jgi:hypothetical protein
VQQAARRHAALRRLRPATWCLVALVAAVCTSASTGATPPNASVADFLVNWQLRLQVNLHAQPVYNYPSPSRKVLDARLQKAVRTYSSRSFSFRVVRVEMRNGGRVAPSVIVQGDRVSAVGDKMAFGNAINDILDLVDPRSPAGRAYAGFFLEARDGLGIPFVARFDMGSHFDGGALGVWGSDPRFYPGNRAPFMPPLKLPSMRDGSDQHCREAVHCDLAPKELA